MIRFTIIIMRKIYFLCLFVSTALQITFAQTFISDSSKVKYTDSLLKISHEYVLSNPDSSAYFAGIALSYSIAHKSELPTAKSQLMLSRFDILKGNVESALIRLNQAKDIYEKYEKKDYLVECYKLMAIAVSKIGKIRDEAAYYEKAYALVLEIDDKTGMASILLNMCLPYSNLKEYDKVLSLLNQCKQYIKPNSDLLFYLYLNYGSVYTDLNKYNLAKINLDSSIAYAKREKMIDSEVTAITFLGALNYKLKDYKLLQWPNYITFQWKSLMH
jgi:tetratricopeptide (TPR) repeat protein